MSTLTELLGGGGGTPTSGAWPDIIFTSSQSWSPPVNMKALVYVLGGGGAGGAAADSLTYRVSSGGGGGTAVSFLTLDSSVTYTVTVGARRTGPFTTSGRVNGSTGNASSFSGSGITTMVGNGGGGGFATVSPTLTLSVGGTATGGNIANRSGNGCFGFVEDLTSGPGGSPNFYDTSVETNYYDFSRSISSIDLGVQESSTDAFYPPESRIFGTAAEQPAFTGGYSKEDPGYAIGQAATIGAGGGAALTDNGNVNGGNGGQGLILIRVLEIL